jgi:hypothetical protein
VRFDRIQLFVRLLVLAAVGVLHQTVGGLFGALYLFLPMLVALLVSRKGGEGFLAQDGSWLIRVLDWVLAVYSYLLFVTDRFPLPSNDRSTHVAVRLGGAPSVGGALARLVTSLPHAVVLSLLGFASTLIAFAAALLVLATERVPEGLYTFQRDVLGWVTRLLAYHSSLVEAYPPFSLQGNDFTSKPNDPGHSSPA